MKQCKTLYYITTETYDGHIFCWKSGHIFLSIYNLNDTPTAFLNEREAKEKLAELKRTESSSEDWEVKQVTIQVSYEDA